MVSRLDLGFPRVGTLIINKDHTPKCNLIISTVEA